ncbi:hypothetical protein [Pseudotabrizicola sp.]|uniref:hypothetical protein n=1 Tax=Pseudotabrizicola sp. TaxID=2939647 RepID=UPI00351E0CD2
MDFEFLGGSVSAAGVCSLGVVDLLDVSGHAGGHISKGLVSVSTDLADFLAAHNFAQWLKTLNGLMPCEYISKMRTSEPDRFTLNPIYQMPGLHTQRTARAHQADHKRNHERFHSMR